MCQLTSMGVDASRGGISPVSGADPFTLTFSVVGALPDIDGALPDMDEALPDIDGASIDGVAMESAAGGATALAAGAAEGAAEAAGVEAAAETGVDKACPRKCCASRRAAATSLCLKSGNVLSMVSKENWVTMRDRYLTPVF